MSGGMSVFIDDECNDFDESEGSSCSDDEQHADGQVADEQTTGGLYVTEADAHGTAATFAGLEARHRRGRGVGDDRGTQRSLVLSRGRLRLRMR